MSVNEIAIHLPDIESTECYSISYLKRWRKIEVLVYREGELVVDVVNQLVASASHKSHWIRHCDLVKRLATKNRSII